MKLRQQPDDFQVEELTDVVPGDAGPFSFYQMDKAGWSTPDALAAVRRRWKVDLRRLSYGGLKDRHARTVQYLTIHHGPRRDLSHHAVHVRYLGQVGSPYTSSDIRANRFRITLRALAPTTRPAVETRLAQVAGQGVPNYFDDQRFGSVAGPGGEFIARHLVRGQFEEALRLALAGPYEHDRAAQKKEKETLHRHWGDWERLKAELPRGHARSLVDYLRVHPGDFRGAAARLRPELRGLYLSAYQSHLWNRLLARWLHEHASPDQFRPVALRLGTVPFHHGLDAGTLEALRALQLPLPTARWKPAADDARLPLVERVLAEEGLTLRDLQVRGVRDLFFSRGERPALCLPQELGHEWGDDERNSGKQCLTLRFDLPRGSYATLVVKGVTGREEGPASGAGERELLSSP
jgi:tRNA pseudouridine13 synthase